MSIELRDYQLDAINKVRTQWANGNTRTVIVHATGLGKSLTAMKIAVDEANRPDGQGRVLVLAHLGEALDQLTKACHQLDPSVSVGRVQANLNEIHAQVIMGSVQTLAHDKRLAMMPKPTMVIVDETHHALAKSYIKILSWASSFESTPTLGVTATLIRGDNQGFGNIFLSVADEKGIDWAVAHGWLVRPHGHAIVAGGMKLRELTVRHGDYVAGELGPMMARNSQEIVKSWQRLASERITIAFTPTVASALELRETFLAAGVASEAVVGITPREDRTLIYKRLAAGETRVLVGVGVMTESFDCPAVSCVLLARPTRSLGLLTQMIGRGVRLFEGKTDCLVLDVVSEEPVHELATLKGMMPSAIHDTTEVLTARQRTAALAHDQAHPIRAALRRWFRGD